MRSMPSGRSSSAASRTIPQRVLENARGPSWTLPNWPHLPRDDLTRALAARLGRGRARGRRQAQSQGAEPRRRNLRRRGPAGHPQFHPCLDADPRLSDSRRLPCQSRSARARAREGSLRARSALLWLREADFDRPIFLDRVLGLEFGTIREIVTILQRTYCQTLAVEFMHISDAAQKGWMQERIEGPDKEISFTREGKRAILNKLIEAEGFEKFCDTKFTGTKRFGLDGGESMIPGARADHQARRRARREGHRARHGASRPPQRAGAGHGQAAPRHLPRVQGRLVVP